mmetsp:Transcript_119771/g.220277  ORF Transcript_119771/g.220277 Transcript_119771/m.220277 type:complete len:281 (-) Transcript_119771:97-939(-)
MADSAISFQSQQPPEVDSATSFQQMPEEKKEEKKETNCCGLCCCRLAEEPDETEVESWEQSGREACGCCPRICHCPVDLGPRQCTWRSAEVGLWINLVFTIRSMFYDGKRLFWLNASEVLLDGWNLGQLAVSFLAISIVRRRDRKALIQVFFCFLIVKVVGLIYKQASIALVVGICELKQVEFKGCAVDLCPSLASCLLIDNCTQADLEGSCACEAPGVDVCKAQNEAFLSKWGTFWALFDLFGWIGGNLPILLAGLTGYNRKRKANLRESKRNLLVASP